MTKHRGSFALGMVVAVAAAGCGDDGGGGDPTGPYFRFDLPADPAVAIPMGGIPYPNDALLDATGKVQVTADSLSLGPDADPDVAASIAGGFARRTGFGRFTGALFPTANLGAGERIDPATLEGRGSLMTLPEPGGSCAPLPVGAPIARADGSLYLEPALGTVFERCTTYGYVIRAGVKTSTGAELVADPELTSLLTTEEPGGASARYAPLRRCVDDPETVVAATVFTTDCNDIDLESARAQLDEAPPAAAQVDRVYRAGAELDGFFGTPADDDFPGSDNPGGIAHADLATVVLGHFAAADYVSAEPRVLGRFDHDGDTLVKKGTEQVPFILTLPRRADLTDLPVVVFGHGFGSSRGIVADVANTLAARGFATIGIDCPSHGDRFSGAQDAIHNFTGAAGPDGLADPAGDLSQLEYLDVVGDPAHGVPALDPRVMSASFQQCAVDLMSVVRLVGGGDWSALATDAPGLRFKADRLVYAGQSMGGVLGTIVTGVDPRVEASVLGVAGGGLLSIATENSPGLWPTFGTLLVGALGVAPDDAIPGVAPPRSNLGFILVQTLLEEADPLFYAHATQGKHVALLTALGDETVPNQSSEALAVALGLDWMTTAKSSPGPRFVEPVPVKTAPLSGNHTAGGSAVTAGWVMLTPATHIMQTAHYTQSRYEGDFPPFAPRATPVTIENPIVGVQAMTAEFARSYVDSGTPRLIDPFRP